MLTCKAIAHEAREVLATETSFTLAKRQQNSKAVLSPFVESRDRRAIAEFHHTTISWKFTGTNIAFVGSKFIQLLKEVSDAACEPIHRDRPIRITLNLSHKNHPAWRVKRFDLKAPAEHIFFELHARNLTDKLRTRLEQHRNHVTVQSKEDVLSRHVEWKVQKYPPYSVCWSNKKSKETYKLQLTNSNRDVMLLSIPYQSDDPFFFW
jgi:hypothetical protein